MTDVVPPLGLPPANPTPVPAVLVQRFDGKVVSGSVFLTMFGLGARVAGGPLEEVPVFTALMAPAEAAALGALLTQAVTALQTLAADESNPQ